VLAEALAAPVRTARITETVLEILAIEPAPAAG
jgi:hypothetical protein